MKTCIVCDTEYKPKVRGTKAAKQKTCSKECRKIYQTGENNPFYGKQHSDETKQKMSQGWSALVESGYKPHNYGQYTAEKRQRTREYDPSWRKIRAAILIRDKETCQVCNSYGNEVHHIIPYKDKKEHKANNLITLCEQCDYMTFHREYDYIELFQNIVRESGHAA